MGGACRFGDARSASRAWRAATKGCPSRRAPGALPRGRPCCRAPPRTSASRAGRSVRRVLAKLPAARTAVGNAPGPLRRLPHNPSARPAHRGVAPPRSIDHPARSPRSGRLQHPAWNRTHYGMPAPHVAARHKRDGCAPQIMVANRGGRQPRAARPDHMVDNGPRYAGHEFRSSVATLGITANASGSTRRAEQARRVAPQDAQECVWPREFAGIGEAKEATGRVPRLQPQQDAPCPRMSAPSGFAERWRQNAEGERSYGKQIRRVRGAHKMMQNRSP